jgi:hypothetical protein
MPNFSILVLARDCHIENNGSMGDRVDYAAPFEANSDQVCAGESRTADTVPQFEAAAGSDGPSIEEAQT